MTKIGDSGKENGDQEKRVISMSSPLYLHPSDTPNMSLTTTKFNGENYDLWAATVKNGLDAKNKLGFIEGTVTKPQGDEGEDNVALVAWRQCNAMLRGWLRSSIEDKLHPSITFSGSVKEIWDELRERYAAGNAPRVHQLKGELSECKQGRESVVEYYTRLKIIWDELANYSRVPTCTCGAAAELTKEREEEKVHQFLMGLDSKLYGNLRSNLLMEDTITSLARAYSLVLREERHMNVTREKEERSEIAMSMKTNGVGRGKGVSGGQGVVDEEEIPQCTHCGKLYHTEDTCYGKHGYEAVKARGRGRGRRGMSGGRGNTTRGGRIGGRGQQATHQANAVGATGSGKETNTQPSSSFSSEEIERLRLMIAGSPEGSEKLTANKEFSLENEETREDRIEKMAHEDRGSEQWCAVDEADEVALNNEEHGVTDHVEEHNDAGEVENNNERKWLEKVAVAKFTEAVYLMEGGSSQNIEAIRGCVAGVHC
ncbi:hypothetical protein BVRB_5g117090 [Beta vulgaris subsp. vulgaris]|nr:hypothetical protein BVRB_5g117090 [Beta vulgaris subsp. vulgaris]